MALLFWLAAACAVGYLLRDRSEKPVLTFLPTTLNCARRHPWGRVSRAAPGRARRLPSRAPRATGGVLTQAAAASSRTYAHAGFLLARCKALDRFSPTRWASHFVLQTVFGHAQRPPGWASSEG